MYCKRVSRAVSPQSGSTSACVGLSLDLYVSLYSRPESIKRRGRFKHPRVVRPCCTNVRRGGVLRKVSEAKRSSGGAACVVAAQLAAGDERGRERSVEGETRQRLTDAAKHPSEGLSEPCWLRRSGRASPQPDQDGYDYDQGISYIIQD